jgi:hypothetical protein
MNLPSISKTVGDTSIIFSYVEDNNKKIIIEKYVTISHFYIRGDSLDLWAKNQNLIIQTPKDNYVNGKENFFLSVQHNKSRYLYNLYFRKQMLSYYISYHPEYEKYQMLYGNK